jgi:hypothetical protein
MADTKEKKLVRIAEKKVLHLIQKGLFVDAFTATYEYWINNYYTTPQISRYFIENIVDGNWEMKESESFIAKRYKNEDEKERIREDLNKQKESELVRLRDLPADTPAWRNINVLPDINGFVGTASQADIERDARGGKKRCCVDALSLIAIKFACLGLLDEAKNTLRQANNIAYNITIDDFSEMVITLDGVKRVSTLKNPVELEKKVRSIAYDAIWEASLKINLLKKMQRVDLQRSLNIVDNYISHCVKMCKIKKCTYGLEELNIGIEDIVNLICDKVIRTDVQNRKIRKENIRQLAYYVFRKRNKVLDKKDKTLLSLMHIIARQIEDKQSLKLIFINLHQKYDKGTV